MEHNMVGWFEIPVIDMGRAKQFYEKVFNLKVQIQNFGGTLMGWFPWADGKPGAPGSLIQQKAYEPSDTKGVLVYFSSKEITDELNRVEEAGGKVIQPKTQISPEVGYMALFLDSEGNRIALHSRV